MSDENVVFNPGEESYADRGGRVRANGRLVAWFMKATGLQSEGVANLALFIVAVACFVAAVIIYFKYA